MLKVVVPRLPAVLLYPMEYSVGLMNPTVENPAARLRVLTSVIIPANTGAEADEPYIPITVPPMTT